MRFFRLIAITVLLLAFVAMGVACTGAKGEKGDQGADGVGIQSIANNTDGTLTIYLTNGQSYTTGDLRGPQGEKGATGAAGAKGDTGATGAAGAKGDTGVGLSPSYATVDTWETTYDNLTSANLPTVGPSVTVTIGSSGSALVTLATGIQAYTNCFGYMGFAVSGATNRAMNSSQKVGGGNAAAMTTLQSGATYMVTGLNPGVTTFTAKYDAVIFYVGGYVAFYYRSIIVQPL
jgi:hypothetical protein